MRVRFSIVIFAVSVLLTLAGATAWAVSYRDSAWLWVSLTHDWSAAVLIDRGTLALAAESVAAADVFPRLPRFRRVEFGHHHAKGPRIIDTAPEPVLGFALSRDGPEKMIWLPLWFVVAAGLLGCTLFGRFGFRKRKRGLCPQCGYDLRASPDGCPECGTAIISDASAIV
jgi:hypothetical protein